MNKVRVYFDFNDWWIGYYRSPNYHYVCVIPTLVVKWARSFKLPPPIYIDPKHASKFIIPKHIEDQILEPYWDMLRDKGKKKED